MNGTASEQYMEREKRLAEAIELRIPDRVPVIANMGYFPARYTGITCEAAWYDYDNWLEAYRKTLCLPPCYRSVQLMMSGITVKNLSM